MINSRPTPDDLQRASIKQQIRDGAAKVPYPPLATLTNGEEQSHGPQYPLNFTKGLPHDEYGIVMPGAYETWTASINEEYLHGTAPQDFTNVPQGEGKIVGESAGTRLPWRGWESPRSGHAYDLMGPDSGEVAMPPAPLLGSDELVGEMAEVYAMALLRDVDFEVIQDGGTKQVTDVIALLNKLPWFSGPRQIPQEGLFRGSTNGSRVGPYISQFLLQGPMASGASTTTVPYGAQQVDLTVDGFALNEDYMTTWNAWLDVQQGADPVGLQPPNATRRLIQTPRDLARYVQIDALYQAYQVATLTLLATGTPTQSGFPSGGRRDPRASFATFGGPHILSLVTEVATRALRAVRRQKFNHHRRGRPERIGAMLTLASNGLGHAMGNAQSGIEMMLRDLEASGMAKAIDNFNQKATLPPAVQAIPQWNTNPNWWLKNKGSKNMLLPMAFIEGSPMHPAYGAGHATVAGACVTMMKCFFELVQGMMPGQNQISLTDIGLSNLAHDPKGKFSANDLTVNGELDKIAANISIGRNMAGVHFATDYTESVRMGERIAVGMVAEQLLTYGEPVSILIETFDGDRLKMHTRGASFPRIVHFDIVSKGGQTVSFDDWWNRHSKTVAKTT